MSDGALRQPAFNNRDASYELVDVDGDVRIVYRHADRRSYRDEVLEAARVVAASPCDYLPRIYDVQPTRIVAEYLDGYVPLSKAGVTSTRFNRFTSRPRRFKRWRLRKDQKDMRDHLDEFIHQLGELGAYFKAHELWHDDVIPQNVMWSSARHAMKLVDVSAWFPRRYLDHGRELYNDGRTRGVFRRDNTVDTDYVRDVFLQDLAPWVMVMLRKAGFFIKK